MLLCPWDFPGNNTGVGCHCLLQRIFPTQGLNPGLLHCRQTVYCLSHQGSPILEKGFLQSLRGRKSVPWWEKSRPKVKEELHYREEKWLLHRENPCWSLHVQQDSSLLEAGKMQPTVQRLLGPSWFSVGVHCRLNREPAVLSWRFGKEKTHA